MSSEKLQKVLARAGLGSRRQMETWIAARRVSVNGKIVELGARVGEKDVIRVDGKRLDNKKLFDAPTKVLIYHKPVGEVCTRRPETGQKSIFASLPKCHQGRWINVGRLDINTSGMLLVTNDGELANRLMHPSSELEREYAVRILGEVTPEMLSALRSEVMLEDGPAHFDFIKSAGGQGANQWFHVVTKEGRNRIVRRLWESQGVTVSRLIRVRFGNMVLPRRIPAGKWTYLSELDIRKLKMLLPKPGKDKPKEA